MNIDMEDARYTDGNGKMVRLENFHVRGRKVRYVHIPDQVSEELGLEELENSEEK